MGTEFFIIFITILILSVIIHEVSHGYVAYMLGDPTAKLAGRLTLNPIKHLDPVGSFIVPVLMFFSTGFMFGWARPVPYNPYNLRNQRWGTALVGAAGALLNLFIAIVFGIFIRFAAALGLSSAVVEISSLIVFVNLILAVFNMIPVPPLDGSKVLFSLLPYRFHHIQEFLERNALFLVGILIFLIFTGFIKLDPILNFLFSVITGIPLFI